MPTIRWGKTMTQVHVSEDASTHRTKQMVRDRKKSARALWFYVPVTVVTAFVFSQYPSWGTGVLLGLSLMALTGDLYVYVSCSIKLRRQRGPS